MGISVSGKKKSHMRSKIESHGKPGLQKRTQVQSQVLYADNWRMRDPGFILRRSATIPELSLGGGGGF